MGRSTPKIKQYVIYYHGDPRDNTLTYIGQSVNGLVRAREHLRPSNLKRRENPRHCNWILKLQSLGLKPDIGILEELNSEEELNEAEVFWIGYFRFIGQDLHNISDGGNRPPKMVNTPEMIEALIARNKACDYPRGHKASLETRERQRQSMLGLIRGPMSEEHKTKVAIARGGKPFIDQNGNLYFNIAGFARSIGARRQDVQRVLRNKVYKGVHRHSIKGYYLRYATEEEIKSKEGL